MRQNVRVEMTDRGLHEAMGTSQFIEIEPYNLGGWFLALFVSLAAWAVAAWFILP